MAEKPKLLDACREALRIPADCTDFDAEIEDLIEAARAAMRAGGVADAVAAAAMAVKNEAVRFNEIDGTAVRREIRLPDKF